MSGIKRAAWAVLLGAAGTLGASAPSFAADAASPGAAISGDHACQPGESWDFGTAIPQEFADSFHDFLGKRIPAVRGFSEALALRRQATDPEQKYFAEYWVSRALYGAKLVHIARNGFAVLASRPVSDETLGAQLGALQCLTEIHSRFPAIDIPASVIARIPDYLAVASRTHRLEPVWDVATVFALSRLGRPDRMSAAETSELLSWLQGSGARESLVRGLIAAQKSDHSTVIEQLKAFLDGPRPPALDRYVDTAEMLIARSFYSLGRYEASIYHFKQVSKSSDQLADSLQELSWAYLMAERYREAIGTAMNLQAGGLSKTFTPEAPMVMAMAMNEICQYPESVNAANLFRKDYAKSFKWLDQWENSGQTRDLYPLAIQYLRRKPSVPDRVASEWVRSPLFISDQEEIDLLFDEKDAASGLGKGGSRVQTQLAQSVLDDLRDLKPKFYEAKAKQKPGEPLPGRIVNDLHKLKSELIAFRRMQRAAPIWKAVLAHYQRQAPSIEKHLVAEIESDLKLRSARMHDQIAEVAENVQLIEVEIYNGASQDIIWQNAHPGYKKMAKQLDDDPDRMPASQVWNWGKTRLSSDDDNVEVWEDELGSFKADLIDNCASKDKYLRLRSKRRLDAANDASN